MGIYHQYTKQLTKHNLLTAMFTSLPLPHPPCNRMFVVSRREVEGQQMKAHISQVRSTFEQLACAPH